MAIIQVDLHLPVPCPQVDLSKVLSLPKLNQTVIDQGDGVLVIPTDDIQPSGVHRNLHEPLLGLGAKSIGAAFTVARVDQPVFLCGLSGLPDGGIHPKGSPAGAAKTTVCFAVQSFGVHHKPLFMAWSCQTAVI